MATKGLRACLIALSPTLGADGIENMRRPSCFKKTSITNHSSVSRPLPFSDYDELPIKILWATLDLIAIAVLVSGIVLWVSEGKASRSDRTTVPQPRLYQQPKSPTQVYRWPGRTCDCLRVWTILRPYMRGSVGRSIVVTLAALRVAVNPLDSEEFDSESVERFVSTNADLVS